MWRPNFSPVLTTAARTRPKSKPPGRPRSGVPAECLLEVRRGFLAGRSHPRRVGSARPVSLRKLPCQADHSNGDCTADEGLGRNVRGGTRPRLSWGRSPL